MGAAPERHWREDRGKCNSVGSHPLSPPAWDRQHIRSTITQVRRRIHDRRMRQQEEVRREGPRGGADSVTTVRRTKLTNREAASALMIMIITEQAPLLGQEQVTGTCPLRIPALCQGQQGQAKARRLCRQLGHDSLVFGDDAPKDRGEGRPQGGSL